MMFISKIKKMIDFLKKFPQPSMAEFIKNNKIKIATSGVVNNEWQEFKNNIVSELNDHPSDFLRQPTISKTIHPNQQKIAQKYLHELKDDDFIAGKVMPTLHDLPIGNPYICEVFPLASPQTIQHIYYFSLIQKKLGFFIASNQISFILELGGGYGNFCRLVYEYGYTGDYSIVDFLEMHSLQKHFLSYALPDNNIEFHSTDNNNTFTQPKTGKSLFVATFSLNEMTIDDRNKMEKVFVEFDYLFIAYNKEIFSIDNAEYFDTLKNRLSGTFDINIVKDKHRQAWFLFGKRM